MGAVVGVAVQHPQYRCDLRLLLRFVPDTVSETGSGSGSKEGSTGNPARR